MLHILVSVSALLSRSSSSCWGSGMTGVLCWHLWPVFYRVLHSDGGKGTYLASVLGREYDVKLYELQMVQGSFCFISCGRKWDSVFYGKVFSGKSAILPHLPLFAL